MSNQVDFSLVYRIPYFERRYILTIGGRARRMNLLLILLMLLRVQRNRNRCWRGSFGIANRSSWPLIQLRSPINFLVVTVPSGGSRFSRATTVRVGRAPFRLHLPVPVIQARFIRSEALLRRLIHPRPIDHAASVVVRHRALAGHRNVRRYR